jgi:hypothetical protein
MNSGSDAGAEARSDSVSQVRNDAGAGARSDSVSQVRNDAGAGARSDSVSQVRNDAAPDGGRDGTTEAGRDIGAGGEGGAEAGGDGVVARDTASASRDSGTLPLDSGDASFAMPDLSRETAQASEAGANPDANDAAPATCPSPPNTPGGSDGTGGCWPFEGNTGVPAGVVLAKYTGPCTLKSSNAGPSVVIDQQDATKCDILAIYDVAVEIKNSIGVGCTGPGFMRGPPGLGCEARGRARHLGCRRQL